MINSEVITMYIILLIVIYILNIVDYCQTIYATRILGMGVEANPIARFFLENNCDGIFKLVVVPIILTMIGLIIWIDRRKIWGAYFLLVYFCCVVIHNFIALSRMGLF